MDDIPTALMTILMVVIVLFLTYTVISNFHTRADSTSAINQTQEAVDFLDKYDTRFLRAWDFGVLFLAILLPIFSYIMARRIPVDPLNVIIVFFTLGFFMLAGMIMTNIYGGFQDATVFQNFLDQTRYIPFLMPNLLYYTIIYSIVVVLGLFAKEEGSL